MKNLLLLFMLCFASCTIAPRVTVSNTDNGNKSNTVINGKLYASAYQQRAAEYNALCLQAFNLATQRVNEAMQSKTDKPRAIITDIDETILDNSKYEAHQTLQGEDYGSASWVEWTAMVDADTVPGAVPFLKYAASKGIEIFYVTNRGEKERDATLSNLRKFNLPDADSAHLFPRQNASSKEERRQSITAGHVVVMLLGDDLADFSSLFDKGTAQERKENVNVVAEEFGKKFIILPNPIYGDWEAALYNYNYSLTAAQKDSVLKASLHTY